jgi:hypothetical protein
MGLRMECEEKCSHKTHHPDHGTNKLYVDYAVSNSSSIYLPSLQEENFILSQVSYLIFRSILHKYLKFILYMPIAVAARSKA